ncbi:MAG: diguanylate cyclase [Verrucomicrobia bacterium RIFCSPLOWO2_12_FULL_64_8]|nr:MAG: diguanylate cyclase [Verrucomicrobia bacterium RIFCSPLOWO2_12_FULL_64_8]
MHLLGLHHVTAIASNPPRHVDFYTRVLGLRLVKKTVNFDDPGTYHLYYGDYAASPGSLLTFFFWGDLRRGRLGAGQVSATAFSVPAGSLPFWRKRLQTQGFVPAEPTARFEAQVLAFTDPDGLVLELLATAEPDPRTPAPHPEIPSEHGIRGFHGVTLAVADAGPTAQFLTEVMGYRRLAQGKYRTRFTVGDGRPGSFVDVHDDPALPRALPGSGTVHHVAFRAPDAAEQRNALEELVASGHDVSPVMDRKYFQSIYYREPQGILLEIATDPPGMNVDEPLDQLGRRLALPPWYETHRAEIEASLPRLG